MSIIPLIVDGPDKNVVETDQDFQDANGLNGKTILIKSLDKSQLLSEKDSNVSYDLRVGREYRDHRNSGKKTLSEDGAIKLLPKAAVIIETEEYVHFPRHAFGLIVPKVSLLQRGISNTSSKIDPGYNGNLLITVFNLGKKTVTLKRFQPFCSLHVHEIGKGVRPYTKSQKRIEGESERKILQQFNDFLEAKQVLFSVFLAIATLILTIVQIANYLK